MSKPVHVIATIVAKPGQEAAVGEMLKKLVGTTRKEDGCVNYALFAVTKTPTHFYTVEEWASQAALDTHIAGVGGVIEDAMPLLAAPPQIDVLGAPLA